MLLLHCQFIASQKRPATRRGGLSRPQEPREFPLLARFSLQISLRRLGNLQNFSSEGVRRAGASASVSQRVSTLPAPAQPAPSDGRGPLIASQAALPPAHRDGGHLDSRHLNRLALRFRPGLLQVRLPAVPRRLHAIWPGALACGRDDGEGGNCATKRPLPAEAPHSSNQYPLPRCSSFPSLPCSR